MNAWGQGHLLTFANGQFGWIYMYLKSFFLETTRLMKLIFHMKTMWDERMKFSSKGLGHMTKVAAMPIYGKNL